MKYLKPGNIIRCEGCGAYIRIDNMEKDTECSWNFSRTSYNRYVCCPVCGDYVYIETLKEYK